MPSRSASSWLKVVPFGIRRMMNWIKEEYGADVDIYITENGFSDYQVTQKSLRLQSASGSEGLKEKLSLKRKRFSKYLF